MAERVLAAAAHGAVESSRFERLARVYAVAASVMAAVGVAGAMWARPAARAVVPARAPSVHDLEEARLTHAGRVSVTRLTVDGEVTPMVRTLTIVTLLALVAGLSVGFFVAEVSATARPVATTTPVDPVVEQRVLDYVRFYDLAPAQADEVRAALKEYDQGLLNLLNRLRVQHRDDFKALSDRADARIRGVLPPPRDR